MKRPLYQQECCVVFPTRESELFYMNMRVYRVEQADRVGEGPDVESKLIWCAVYQPQETTQH